ncbi:hypothetical protein L1987_19945 [Smallanthus sonchifolius]|uniref:Uncharacterized protein n=1 Tax=Smallanthus sonchifolius TaxID=185202 RepID=A0ACB9IS37_9ASTR|nr:hypothetical protein L1987_19945 [Smallanthus sonchifolius]
MRVLASPSPIAVADDRTTDEFCLTIHHRWRYLQLSTQHHRESANAVPKPSVLNMPLTRLVSRIPSPAHCKKSIMSLNFRHYHDGDQDCNGGEICGPNTLICLFLRHD